MTKKKRLLYKAMMFLKNAELARKALQKDKILASKNILPFLSIYKKLYPIQNYLFQLHIISEICM